MYQNAWNGLPVDRIDLDPLTKFKRSSQHIDLSALVG